MILHGRDLIIKRDGIALFACKNCTLNVQQASIAVSSPNSGQWEESIGGRMSWSLSSGHLVGTTATPTFIIDAFSRAHDGFSLDINNPSFVKTSQFMRTLPQRGLTLTFIRYDGTYINHVNYDTYGESEEEYATNCNTMAAYIGQIQSNHAVVLTSWDAYGMNEYLRTNLQNFFHVDLSMLRLGRPREALCIIGGNTIPQGVVGYANYSLYQGNTTRARMAVGVIESAITPITDTPLRDAVFTVGQTYDIEVSVGGLPYDRLTGRARCQTFDVQGATGNLMQGSFRWIGTGPLT